MDYQFIHSVVKGAYVDLPSGRAVPGAYLNELRSYAGAGDGLEHVPGGVYSYVTLRRGSEPAAAFLSHVERKKNASYPCNFIQSAGWTVHGDLLLRQFDTMLAQAFFTEEQVDGFAESGETPPLWEDGGRSLPDVSIHESALRAILYGCLFYWQTGAAPVRVAVPRSESARYNEYVLGAVREIYSHFPANMRAAVGFCSCLLPAHEANFRRFGLIFLPQAMADARTILLDGSSHSAYEAIPRSTGLVSLDLVLEYLISLKDPAARRSFLDTVYENVEAADKTGTFSPVTYSILGDYMRHLDPGSSVQDLIPLWLGFTADREKYPAALAQEIESCIEERLTGEELKRYAGSVLSDQSSPEEVLRAEGSLLRLCAGRDDCRQAVWEDLSARLAGSGCRPEDVYGALRHHRSALSGLAGPDAYERELSVWGLKIAQERRDREIGELRKLPDQYPRATEDLSRALNTRVEAFRQEIQPYTGEGELAELCAEVRGEADRLLLCRLEELVCLAPVSGQTSDESIDTWLKRLQRIETMLPGIRESDALRDEIRAKQERLTEIGLSRDAQLNELIDAIGGETNYFSALKRAAETVGAFSSVKIGQVRDTLRRRRPISCISYAKAYRDTFGSSVTVCARPEKPGFFTDVVEEDMAFFFGRTETISLSGKDTDTLVQDLDDLVRLADAFGHRGGLKVRLDERCEEDAAVVRQVCALESKSLTVRQFSSVSDVLLKNGCYQKTKLPDLLKLADKLEADLRPLTRRVLEGCVPDMDADDYRGFFEDLYPILPKNDYIACREWICEQARRTQPLDDEAKRALGALEKEIDAEKNRRRRRKRSLIIAAVTLGVLLLAGGVIYALHAFGVLSFGSKTEKPAEITAQTVENRRSGDALDLSGFENLSDLSILSGLEDIRVLKLDGDKQLKPGDLRDLKGLGALDYLSLSGIPGVTEDLAAEIAKNNNSCVVRWTESQQEHVYLCKTTLPLEGDAWEIPDASGLARLLPIRDELQSLRRLTLRSADLTADDLALLWELGGLEVLDLSGAGLRDETVSALTARDDLAEPAALRLLVLAGNPGLSDGAIELLRTTLPDACYIDRSGTGETSSDEVLIAGELYPRDATTLDLHRRRLKGEDLELIAGMSSLTSLNLADTTIPRLPDLSQLASLKELNVSGCKLESVPDLSGLAELRRLDLSGVPLQPETTLKLPKSLRTLKLSGCGLSALPFGSVPADLEILDLSGNELADANLSALTGSSLRVLMLANCGLNAACDLRALASLQTLDLSGNSVSDLNAGETLPPSLLGLSLAKNGESLTLHGMNALESLSWLNLSDTVWQLPDTEADPSAPDELLRALPGLKVLIVSGRETAEYGRVGDCYILPDFYYNPDAVKNLNPTALPPEEPGGEGADEEAGETTAEDTGEAAAENNGETASEEAGDAAETDTAEDTGADEPGT